MMRGAMDTTFETQDVPIFDEPQFEAEADENFDDDEPTPQQKTKTGAGSPAAVQRRHDRAVAAAALAIHGEKPQVRKVLAHLLGTSKSDPASLTVEVFNASTSAIAAPALVDLTVLRDDGEADRPFTAMGFGDDRLKAVAALLVVAGAEVKPTGRKTADIARAVIAAMTNTSALTLIDKARERGRRV